MLLILRRIGQQLATLVRRPAETAPEPTLQDGDVVCPRCSGSGVDPVKNDPTNRCRNFLNADRTDSGVPVCRACGGYGTVPEDCLPWIEAQNWPN